MEKIEKVINKNINHKLNLKDKKICFLDIETTGLNRTRDSIYLVGIGYYDDKLLSWKIVQFLAEELSEEVDVLLEAYRLLSKFDIIVNYNGTSFDIPFINNKLKFYRSNLSLDVDKSLDLYRIIRSNKNILQLENYKLESIERYLGIHRKDKYTGKECIDFYRDYLINKNSLSKKKILLHNYEDLYYLLDVIKILDILESKKSFTINHKGQDNVFLIESIEFLKDYIFIRGNIDKNNIGNTVYFADNYKFILENKGDFEISFEVLEGMVTSSKKCVFIKAEDFNLPKDEYWVNEFKIPRGIILLSVEKKDCIDNIKLVSKNLIENII